MSNQDVRTLLRLLDAMDDHFDHKISGHQFVRQAASAQASLNPSPAQDPRLVAAIRALSDFLNAATSELLPDEPYWSLRLALAELEELR